MKISYGLIFLCIVFNGCAYSNINKSKEDDIKLFLELADNCEYLSGKWDSNLTEKRKKEIEKQVDKYCGEASRMKKKLKTKYKGNVDIEEKLNNYDFY